MAILNSFLVLCVVLVGGGGGDASVCVSVCVGGSPRHAV